MNTVNAYAAAKAKEPLKPFSIQRRNPGPQDVVIDIEFCGVCHSDVHQARDEWGRGIFPMVPGHEIAGKVTAVGANVSRYKVGDRVGVGCFTDSCRECSACRQDLQQYCEKGMTQTYNCLEKDSKNPSYGGYSTQIVVDENYVLRIPENIPLEKAAPLLCAGITTYSPLRHWKVKATDKVGVVGLGGLGHMALKLAVAMGAEVTVLSHSDSKKADALEMGAKHFVNTTEKSALKKLSNSFDFIINTVSAAIDLNDFLMLLKRDGTLVVVGVPERPAAINAFPLIVSRRSLSGSLIGGIKETQEMLDFCGQHNVTPEIELIPIDKINEAYDRMVNGDVRYRFVIDISSLRS
jgi:uncharacterized zinc-type alcohol dehydrogenase-like protein